MNEDEDAAAPEPRIGDDEETRSKVIQIASGDPLPDEAPIDESATGEGPAPFAEALEVPPDPGSADATSPRLQSIVESLLFASDKPLSLKQLGDLLGETELVRVR